MKKLALIITLFISSICFAQDKTPVTDEDYQNDNVEMADAFREEGKIYILTGVILIILVGTIFYLISIDLKVSNLEKQLKK